MSNKLYAIPFDRYDSEFTSEGVIYNIVNEDLEVIIQYMVAHKKYTLHDLLIETTSGAPSNARIALQQELDAKFGKNEWEMMTAFSSKMIQKSPKLMEKKFTEDSFRLIYNPKSKEVEKSRANQNSQKGF